MLSKLLKDSESIVQGTKMKQDNLLQKTQRLLRRARDISRKKGIYYVCWAGSKRFLTQLKNTSEYYYYKAFKSSAFFTFQKERYKYFYHKYNPTWRNERAVEIPIIWRTVRKYEGKNILEVGNVLSNYFPVKHDVIDKYEKAENVITQDAADFHPAKKYDLIVSISTLEHVGWDENPSDHKILNEPDTVLRAIENLKGLLALEGTLVITLPLGYNPCLDKLLKSDQTKFGRRFCLKRVSKDNKWIEASWEDIKNAKYNSPFPAANGLLIGIIKP